MKLLGNIEVFDYARNTSVSRSRHSTVTICNDKGAVILLVQQPSHKAGLKYKVSQNIVKVFTKCIKDGKATIRLKDPSHELRIANEAIQLKSFLLLLHSCCKAEVPSLPPLLATPKFKKAPPKAAVIDSLKDYGLLDRLSLKVTNLRISNVPMKGLPSSVSRLKELAVLEVDKAELITFPKCLGRFPVLTSLILTNNNLQSCKLWMFLNSPTLQKQLKLLDLRHNQITVLPPRICALQELVTLKLDHNLLYTLPHTLPRMKKLRYFTTSNNKILSFPSTLFHLKHVSIDISNNPQHFPVHEQYHVSCNTEMRNEDEIKEAHYTALHSLKELASRVIINKRVPYNKIGLPTCLSHHLDEAKFCQQCGKSCFSQYFVVFSHAPVKNFVPDLMSSGTNITTYFFVCSRECMLLSYPKLNPPSQTSVCYLSYSL